MTTKEWERPFSQWGDRSRTITAQDAWVCYGELPDGRMYGVKSFPVTGDPWSREYRTVVTDAAGTLCQGSSGLPHSQNMPAVLTASPSGRTLIWYDSGMLALGDLINVLNGWPWELVHQRLPGEPIITDARLLQNGLLTLSLANRERWACFCDGMALLKETEEGWVLWRYPVDAPGYSLEAEDLDAAGIRLVGLCLDESVHTVPFHAFSGLEPLRSVELPAGLNRIEAYAFEDDAQLEAIRIPAEVDEVEYRAFGGCASLRRLEILGDPARLIRWDESAFEGCPCASNYLRLRGQ